jgi:3-dehydroquinate synthase II
VSREGRRLLVVDARRRKNGGGEKILLLATLLSCAGFELWLDVRNGLPGSIPGAQDLFDRKLGTELLVTEQHQIVDETGAITGAVIQARASDRSSGGSLNDFVSDEALSLIGSVRWLMVEDSGGSPMLTAENLLAVAEGTPTHIAMRCSEACEVGGLAFALSRGVDALVVPAASLLTSDAADEDEDGSAAAALLEALAIAKSQRLEDAAAEASAEDEVGGEVSAEAPLQAITLRSGSLLSVEPAGVGDRVALDFTRLLADGEGCLLGSSAKRLCLVLGETAQSGFVPPRPFRVNAGPVHQYVLMADGRTTKYLEEVRAGDEVLVVRASDGAARACVVGRCKIEPRPMLMLRVQAAPVQLAAGKQDDLDMDVAEEATACVFLQQAETVALASIDCSLDDLDADASNMGGAGGTWRLPVTQARPGDKLLVRCHELGTHVGQAIRARVEER